MQPQPLLDPSLTALELDIVAALSRSRVTASSVTLAADVWRTNENWSSFDVEPIVSLVIRSLGEQGLVTYHEKDGTPFPFDIRLTRDGWALAGYPVSHAEVGAPSRHRYRTGHWGDRTDYRNHRFHAEAGPIYTEDFPTHFAHFPHHQHDYGEAFMAMHPHADDVRVIDNPDGESPRTYIKVTPDIEARVLSARQRLGTVPYSEVADYTGIPERTVRYILTDLPRLRRTRDGTEGEGSLRERILATLSVIGTVGDVAELQRVLGKADDKHHLTHVLHALHTGGLIDFREAGARDHIVDIRLRKKGTTRKAKAQEHKVKPEITDDRDRAQDAETLVADMDERDAPVVELDGFEVDATSVVSVADIPGMDDESDDFPLLDELILREAKRQSGDETALAYIAAANAIEKIDPQMAADLMAKAKALDVPYPSPLEREYLRYAVWAAKKGEPND
jgi:hypothetical protein